MVLEIKQTEKYKFQAEIYKTGINYCVDVPKNITSELIAIKGYIKVKGIVNEFPFKKHLVPVKFGLYRLFVNVPTLKGAKTSVGEFANFEIEQGFEVEIKEYPVQKILLSSLAENESGICVGVDDSSLEFLRFLDRQGIALGQHITVIEKEPFDDSLRIRINEKELSISHKIATNLYIRK